MKEELLETIEKQIRDQNPKCTKEYYELLLSHGIEQEEAKDFLVALLELHVRIMLLQNSEFDEDLWNNNLKRMCNRVLESIKETAITPYQMEKNISRIRKDVGFLPMGDEIIYDEELNVLESSIYAFHQAYGINSIDAKQIVMIVMNHLYSYITGNFYDLFTGYDKKMYLISDLLEEKCNPYINEHLKELLSHQVKINHEEDKKIFTPMLLCLGRIYKSITYWEKEMGSNGYFTFLSQCEDELFQTNPNMAFTKFTLDKQ